MDKKELIREKAGALIVQIRAVENIIAGYRYLNRIKRDPENDAAISRWQKDGEHYRRQLAELQEHCPHEWVDEPGYHHIRRCRICGKVERL